MRHDARIVLAALLLSACESPVQGPAEVIDLRRFHAAVVPGAAAGYIVVELGTLGGEVESAEYINEAGQVLGTSRIGGAERVFVWENGVLTDIGTLGGTTSELPGVLPMWPFSEAGHVIGRSMTAGDAEQHAFLWYQGNMTDLGPVDVRAVNASGQVTGSTDRFGAGRAFIWANGAMTDLGTLGGDFAAAHSINDLGQIVGNSTRPGNTAWHIFLWENGTIEGIGTLSADAVFDIPYEINDQGLITGRAHVSATVQQGFLWESGVMTDLGNLGGSGAVRLSQPRSVNARRQVVGFSLTPLGQNHAFKWENGVMNALPGLGGPFSSAAEINDAGQVVGSATSAGGVVHAVLWNGDDVVDLGPGAANSINAAGWIAGRVVSEGSASRAVIWRPGTAAELIGATENEVANLVVAGDLSAGEGNSLLAKLTAAAAAVEDGNVQTALNQLAAFINQLRAFVLSGRLSQETAQSLIDRVHAAMNGLS